ncbi:hypothetical protein [Sediminitomix flava]|uniref:Uncharacterized protein n=1 Tax=Sediminitomix flava TaxID=379075 RepID=A0A315ZIX5_SEDFL|nr:hypothetical protein [Sediminitomix flava]PWJ45040.1 hypothetical protein BC781_1011443 [Sediminitomix flava]
MNYEYHYTKNKEEQKCSYTSEISSGYPTDDFVAYSYSYRYKWVKMIDNPIERCVFNEGDEMRLTNLSLQIEQKHHSREIDLDYIKQVTLQFRRIMFPLIFGGLLSAFSLIGLLTGVMKSALALSLVLGGIMLFYYGYKGSYQLMIELQGGQVALFIDEKTPELKKFIARTNYYLHRKF